MNETINLRRLCAMISEYTGWNEAESEKFIDAIFEYIATSLETSGIAQLPGLGNLKVDHEACDIIFSPDNAIAEAVNEPFSFFEAVELNVESDVLDKETNTEMESDNDSDKDKEPEAPQAEIEPEHCEPMMDLEDITSISTTDNSGNDVCQGDDYIDESVPDEDMEAEDNIEIIRETKAWPVMAGVALGLVTGMIIGFFGHDRFVGSNTTIQEESDSIQEVVTTIQHTPVDTVAVYLLDPPEPISPETKHSESPIITDTVTAHRFLATMAREYYGVMEYWIFIYEENRDILPANPNKIKPGTAVVIPPLEKYVPDGNATKGRAEAARRISRLERSLH